MWIGLWSQRQRLNPKNSNLTESPTIVTTYTVVCSARNEASIITDKTDRDRNYFLLSSSYHPTGPRAQPIGIYTSLRPYVPWNSMELDILFTRGTHPNSPVYVTWLLGPAPGVGPGSLQPHFMDGCAKPQSHQISVMENVMENFGPQLGLPGSTFGLGLYGSP